MSIFLIYVRCRRSTVAAGALGLGVLFAVMLASPVHAEGTIVVPPSSYIAPEAVLEQDADIDSSSRGREFTMLSTAYSVAVPMGDLSDFAGGPSFRGFDLSLLFPLYRGLFVGPAFGFNLLSDRKARESYQLSSATITGKLYRYVHYWSFALATRYVFLQPQQPVRPYAGLRLGVAALDLTSLVVDLSSQDSPTGFLLTPEVGVQVRLADMLHGFLAYQFNFSTASSADFDLLSFSAIQLGLSLQMGL